jgi:hypothetical protein
LSRRDPVGFDPCGSQEARYGATIWARWRLILIASVGPQSGHIAEHWPGYGEHAAAACASHESYGSLVQAAETRVNVNTVTPIRARTRRPAFL